LYAQLSLLTPSNRSAQITSLLSSSKYQSKQLKALPRIDAQEPNIGDTLVWNGTEFVPNAVIGQQFIDVSGSAGSVIPIFAEPTAGVAYYGTVSHTDLFTADGLASELGVTAGTGSSDSNIDDEAVWHKYYWNGGIHFWRKSIRHSISWNNLWSAGAVFGTGTDESRKGFTPTDFDGATGLDGIDQDAEVTKNGVTYAVRLMEGATNDPYVEATASDLHGSEFALILMNLHRTTNSGAYVDNGIDEEWEDTANFTNDDFFGWVTNFGDDDFTVSGNGQAKWQQESSSSRPERRLYRGDFRFSVALAIVASDDIAAIGWSPVLTVKHPAFKYE
jgi:hypothetical protein